MTRLRSKFGNPPGTSTANTRSHPASHNTLSHTVTLSHPEVPGQWMHLRPSLTPVGHWGRLSGCLPRQTSFSNKMFVKSVSGVPPAGRLWIYNDTFWGRLYYKRPQNVSLYIHKRPRIKWLASKPVWGVINWILKGTIAGKLQVNNILRRAIKYIIVWTG